MRGVGRLFARRGASSRSRWLAAIPGVLLVWLYVAQPDLQYSSLERYFYDAILRFSPPIAEEARIVIVDIDERSLAVEGAWPWPRARMAQLVHELTERQQAAVLGLDIVFPEARAGDDALREALNHPNVVMSQIFDFLPASENRIGEVSGQVRIASHASPPTASGYIANDAGLISARANVGHISPMLDADGQVRRLYPLACAAQHCSLALALRMYVQLMGIEASRLRIDYAANGAALHLQSDSSGALTLPLDRDRAWRVPYRVASGGFPVVSATDVMHANAVLPGLENTIVLIGSSALGIGDKVATPLAAVAPGVEIHAQLLSALLDQRFIQPVPASAGIFLALALAVLLSWLLWPGRARSVALLWPLVSLVAVGVMLVWLLVQQGLWLPLSPLPLMVMVIAASHLLIENFMLSDRMSRVASRIGQFLPSILVERLQQESSVGPETERRTMTVLIVDIRGFTAASEGKSPEQIAEFAQKCFEVLSAEVDRYQGTIERYSGDGLVALWGTPRSEPSAHWNAPLHVRPATSDVMAVSDRAHAPYAAQALSAAIAMQRSVAAWSNWFTERHYDALQLCIGLNTGPMSVGVFGGQTHLAWSAQGQAFNIASRIESLTRDLGENILLGEATARLIAAESVRPVGEYSVKGVSAPIAVYALSGDA